MKFILLQRRVLAAVLSCLLIILPASGCGLSGSDTYVVIESHNEQSNTYDTDDVISVNSYLSLKNAILGLAADGISEGSIHVEAYTADVPEDLSQIIYEVSRQNPVGAYMIDYLTYDYSKIVNYYEVSLHITYKHTVEELGKLIYLSDSAQIEEQLKEALENYQNLLLLDIGAYEEKDIKEMVSELLEENPEIMLCIPEVTVNLYPDTGSQRILEIRMNYPADSETMILARDTLADTIDDYIAHCQDTEDKLSICRRVFNRLCRNANVVIASQSENSFCDSMYGAVVCKQGTERSYAVAYQQILLQLGVYCSLVDATYHHSAKILCRVEIDNSVFYVDPAEAIRTSDMTDFAIDPVTLINKGYTILS